MIGKKLSPILEEIEKTLWEFDIRVGDKPDFSTAGFRAAIKIFSSVMMDKIWELQRRENMEPQACAKMAQKAGEDIRKLVKTYTDVDCHGLYQEESSDGKKDL